MLASEADGTVTGLSFSVHLFPFGAAPSLAALSINSEFLDTVSIIKLYLNFLGK